MTAIAIDTETTGLPLWKEPSEHPDQPHVVWLAMVALDDDLNVTGETSLLVRPDGWIIPPEMTAIHGVTMEQAMDEGIPAAQMFEAFAEAVARAQAIVAHNASFDARMMRIIARKLGVPDVLEPRKADLFCTMMKARPLLPKAAKFPSLTECIKHFFDEDLEGAHGALVDARACARVYRVLKRGSL